MLHLQVNLSLTLTSVREVQLADGVANFLGYIAANWIDEQLRWNTSDYNGLSRLSLTGVDIWSPNFIQLYKIQSDFPLTVAYVMSNGLVTWLVAGELRGLCDQDMRLYPFDHHTCNIDFSEAVHDSSEMTLHPIFSFAQIYANITTGGQWKLGSSKAEVILGTNPEVEATGSMFRVSIILERRPEFLIIHMIIPYLLVSLLNIFTYLTPISSGERISFAITLMLAMIFYTTKFSETVPANSMEVSYTSIFTLLGNTYAAASVASSVVLSKLSTSYTKPVPHWLVKRLAKNWKVHELNRKDRGTETSNERTSNRRQQEIGATHLVTRIHDGRKLQEQKIKGCEGSSSDERFMGPKKYFECTDVVTWKEVADYFDRILFWCNLVLTLGTGVTIIALVLIKS